MFILKVKLLELDIDVYYKTCSTIADFSSPINLKLNGRKYEEIEDVAFKNSRVRIARGNKWPWTNAIHLK